MSLVARSVLLYCKNRLFIKEYNTRVSPCYLSSILLLFAQYMLTIWMTKCTKRCRLRMQVGFDTLQTHRHSIPWLIRHPNKKNTSFNRFPFNNFKDFSLSFQSSLHLSFTVLVRYRSLGNIWALDEIYHPKNLCCTSKQHDSKKTQHVLTDSKN